MGVLQPSLLKRRRFVLKMIGIIANPASGKDIRRLVSHATVIDNHEKINIVERIILAAQNCGIEKILIMPDTYHIGYKAEDNLRTSKELKAEIEILDMKITGSYRDSSMAAELMEINNVGCILALGGDGTCRAVAKSIDCTPFIGLSTGTNNVYPKMLEGTVAGIAAAIVTSAGIENKDIQCIRDKRIEIYRNGEFLDIALVDVVISNNTYIGAKAIWNYEDIERIIVTRGHPASIGFSSIVGCRRIVTEEDDFGLSVDISNEYETIIAPLAAGIIKKIGVGRPVEIKVDEELSFIAESKGIIALDGEREITFKKDDELSFKLTRNGPNRVNVKETIEKAQLNGFFNIKS
jgi:predicted polyphosphate/ATP-dependent NAD kinase